ncbi:Eco57I restriction-modification methylase domain-containing protein [Undibacterium sp. Ji49W]|uniref:Eco57I restriction-modification methylase domain-containing protein n=1 Tax=Undibacterium sp. Ji49W TaxID=3413040 RepID=UPI003BF39DAA
MRKLRKAQTALNLPTITLEGGLFLPDQLEKAALGSAQWQAEADYGTPKGLKLKDDYSRAFQIACAQWKHFVTRLERADVDAAAVTQTFVQELLRDVFGFATHSCNGITLGERHYPIGLLADRIPVVVAPHTLSLYDSDTRFAIPGSGVRKKSAFMLTQELLNASPDHLWAITCNGKQLRLLRDAATLTRPSYLEIDLADLLGGQRYAEFANVWRLLHASRAAGKPADCIWERWRAAGQEEGTRVRDRLRLGVTDALLTLGEGFLQYSANEALRNALHSGELSKDAYFQQLLRLIYRLIFLFSVEERGLLHGKDESETAQAARRDYAEGYAVARLRELCLKRRARNRFDDHWQALRIVFKGLNEGEPRLALPALGGLFAIDQCPVLDAASLDNAHLLAAMQNLRWASHKGVLAPVDYRNMGPEELGSVYESLLELVPEIDLPARQFGFVGLTSDGSTAGNARKLSGSYYTPDSLVQELIKSALDPVIEQRLTVQPESPIEALLAIRVIDPACGSGHFLLAAARRLAEKLAQLRATSGEQTEQDFRHALREVVNRCIFGVDRNPMAIELARTALWLEGFEEGRPLGFLDHHLQVGDALLGLTDLNALEMGIAQDAFKPLFGDDKEVCKQLAKTNAAALKDLEKKRNASTFGQLDVTNTPGSGLGQLQALEFLPESTTKEIAAKEAAYRAFLEQAKTSRLAHAADLLVGAYLLPKLAASIDDIPTSATLYLTLLGDALPAQQLGAMAAAQAACKGARVLHWPLAFPQVFASGGFDCVLGNPPWEVSQMGEEEFFTTRAPHIAQLPGDKRKRAIAALPVTDPHLWATYVIEGHRIAAVNNFFRGSGRYPLTAFGKLNTYSLFAETISHICHDKGRCGVIVPTGLITDYSNSNYFDWLVSNNLLISSLAFDNQRKIFPGIHSDTPFTLLTIGKSDGAPEFAAYLLAQEHIYDPRRRYRLSPADIRDINPNTKTAPIFRSRADAELTSKIYKRIPILAHESGPMGFDVEIIQNFFSTSNRIDLRLFSEAEIANDDSIFQVLRGTTIDQYNHRASLYDGSLRKFRSLSVEERDSPAFFTISDKRVSKLEVQKRLNARSWPFQWMMGWRDITNATNERTVIASVFPVSGTDDTLSLLLPKGGSREACLLLANLNSLVLDYVAQQKVGGTHIRKYTISQFPIASCVAYTSSDFAFVIPRVLELTYTAQDLTSWAQDLGYHGAPFSYNAYRRAVLRAELDAWYARAYGLTRDELRYVLDPADVMGEDYPSATFRVLKNKELKEFSEYRTGILVLREFDRMALAEASSEPYVSLLDPQPGQQAQPAYSAHGIVKDEVDSRLLGLLLTMVLQRGRLLRRHLMDALALANQSSLLGAFAEAQSIDVITEFQQHYPSIFDTVRLAGDRIHAWLRHLESVGVIRLDSQTDELVAVSGVAVPTHVLKDDETVRVAAVLIRVAEQVSASAATSDVSSMDTSVKQA